MSNFTLSYSRDGAGFRDAIGDIEELVEAAQGLGEVSAMIKDLKGPESTLISTLSLSRDEVSAITSTFACALCKGIF